MVKVSIIVPIYNAEKYLHRCVDSLLAQDFSDYEILLIDDGSLDASSKICDDYAQKECKVKVFHQKNSGVAAARQLGIEQAQGEYTIHVDADDWVDAAMLKELWSKVEDTKADMVICDYFEEYQNGTKRIIQKCEYSNKSELIRALFQQLHGSCWNKLVRRACYNEVGIKFDTMVSYCEDLLFNVSVIQTGIKVIYLPMAFYHYDQYSNGTSLVKGMSIKKLMSRIQVIKSLEHILKEDLSMYEDLLFLKKAKVKDDVFFGNYYSKELFIELFREINHQYIANYRFPKDKRPLQNAVCLALSGYYGLAQALFKLYKWIRRA